MRNRLRSTLMRLRSNESQDEVLETKKESFQDEQCPNAEPTYGRILSQMWSKRIHQHEFDVRHFFGHVIHEFTTSTQIRFQNFHRPLFRPGLLTAEYLEDAKDAMLIPFGYT